MGIANLGISGSYLAYAYLVLLQISIVYLQRLDHIRRVNEADTSIPAFYAIATGLIGTALNWLSWLASAYVAKMSGWPSGALFFVVGMTSSIIANVVVPRRRLPDLIGHIVSVPATIVLVRALLGALNIPAGF